MIPLKIEIKNFLSYGPDAQIIDFQPYHLICLSGKNGHGKSALLDAITWAIWGQARKTTGTSKADEGLVHLGQKHMLVILDFQVAQTTYKIRREYVKGQSKAFSAVEFGTLQEDGSVKSLTEKTIKTTQEIIERNIGITYDAFINSAFLRQGQSNEFSKKSSKERKEILASILQLQEFDHLKNYALEAIKDLQQSILTKQSVCKHLEQEHAQLQEIPALFATLEQTMQDLQKQEDALLLKKNTHEKEMQKLQQTLHEQMLAKQQLDELSKEAEITIKKLQEIKTNIAEIQQKLAGLSSRHDLEKEKQNAENVIKTFDEKLKQKLHLKEQYLHYKEQEFILQKNLEQAFTASLHESTSTLQLLSQQLVYLQNAKQELQIIYDTKQQEIAAVSKEIQILEANIKAYNTQTVAILQTEYENLQKQFHQTNTSLEHLTAYLEELSSKEKFVHAQDACCPLCEQQISGSRKKFLETKLQNSIMQTQEDLAKAHAQQKELIIALQTSETALQTAQKEFNNFVALKANAQELIQRKEKFNQELSKIMHDQQELSLQLDTSTKEHAILEKKIAQAQQDFIQQQALHPELQALQAKIQNIITQGKSLQYTEQSHLEAQQSLQMFINKLEQSNGQDALCKDQAILQEKKELSEKHLESLTVKIKTLTSQQLPEQNTHCKELEKSILIVHKELEELYQKKQLQAQESGKLQALLQKQESILAQLSSLEKEIQSLEKETSDYQEIARALGKDGIQALLIEEAIPEIEQEANDLLSRLTNNQTQIFIESLRDLKKGGHKETLDIKIADSFGLRPYEMFSGGEAFRIDFALRIAISKLLARRAGTTLQTLIIDEGFGSQDEEGLSLIMDSIYKIQDDFAKVIIVSHLPSLKEQFPVQFIVQKYATGSFIKVIEQG